MKAPALMITCEHASNAVPDFVLRALRDSKIPDEVLASHRGYDIGAYNIFSNLVKRLKPDFHCSSRFSRLVVDMNRSSTSKSFYSEYTASLPSAVKEYMFILWKKYREKIENFVSGIISARERKIEKEAPLKVIHLGIHSFTPVLNDVERDADVGILYDPARPTEAKIATALIKSIHERAPWLKIRKNYPYLGKSDGLTTTLRQKFGPSYAGLEIEINQKLLSK
ncbi:N-formylglutamate amidohydrolase [Fibrobacter sp. UWB12]|uniref:N-formylglutamate amidohydrolase n=1 Tax=Fibrobacter sp. UWB12 TaxID=1896203 RepID=UPI000916D557|nr:N-formylglutamate amidohydrolase [Fibrobacter sp. UWB12]SHK70977.1 Predicted N-formylglutamate amidohydrolase [Fibrobacter sp. UWB12]